MSDGLRRQTAFSFIWSAIDKVGVQFVAFVVGVVTARMLSPYDFGLIGALAAFTILSNALVESGFTAALVRRASNTDAEYVATFVVNIALSVVLYAVLFVTAPLIASFFRMPELCHLSRFLFLAIIINSIGLVQNAILNKELQFKKLTKINLVSGLVSGAVVVLMVVVFDMSYWALAWQQVIMVSVKSLMLWLSSSWRIRCRPDFKVIGELFSFSAFLLLTSVVTTVIRYAYNFVIGRIYSAVDLGYYAQSYKYQQIPSSIVSGTLVSVAYPVLSKLSSDEPRQLLYLRKIMRLTAFFAFPVMFGLMVMAEEFVVVVLSYKWLPIVNYFQILLGVGAMLPFHTLILNALTVRGFTRHNFALEMLRNAMMVLMLCLLHTTIEQMLYGLVIATCLSLVADVVVLAHKVGYKVGDLLKDIAPYLAVALLMALGVYFMKLLPCNVYLLFVLQLLAAVLFYCTLLYLLGSKLLKDVLGFFRVSQK